MTRFSAPGDPVTFTDLSGGANPITGWFWDFGDGSGSSSQQNPTYTYPQSGIYDVELIVEDANGCQDTILREELMDILPDEVPVPPEVSRVTVAAANRTIIHFEPYRNARNDFGQYVLYRQQPGG